MPSHRFYISGVKEESSSQNANTHTQTFAHSTSVQKTMHSIQTHYVLFIVGFVVNNIAKMLKWTRQIVWRASIQNNFKALDYIHIHKLTHTQQAAVF